jgi:hypothetical protein
MGGRLSTGLVRRPPPGRGGVSDRLLARGQLPREARLGDLREQRAELVGAGEGSDERGLGAEG